MKKAGMQCLAACLALLMSLPPSPAWAGAQERDAGKDSAPALSGMGHRASRRRAGHSEEDLVYDPTANLQMQEELIAREKAAAAAAAAKKKSESKKSSSKKRSSKKSSSKKKSSGGGGYKLITY